MTFEKGKFYTHKNMLDMIIYVQHVVSSEDDPLKLRIAWFNNRGMNINQEETVNIYHKELPNWYEWKGFKV